MDVTGYDNVLFSFHRIPNLFPKIIRGLVEIWPCLLIEFMEQGFREILVGSNACEQGLRFDKINDRISFNVYLDESLRGYYREHGYALTVNGDGPFAIHFRTRLCVEFHASGIDEIRTSDSGSCCSPEPYPAILVSPEILEITLITPGHPGLDEFSRSLLNIIVGKSLNP